MKFEKAKKILENRIEKHKAKLAELANAPFVDDPNAKALVKYLKKENERKIAVLEMGLKMTDAEKEKLSLCQYDNDDMSEYAADIMAKYDLTEDEIIPLKDVFCTRRDENAD